MTLKSMAGLLIILAIIGGVAYIAVFERDWALSWFRAGVRAAKGYKPAQTPTECVDRFRDAMKERDYETAATYCGGDYAEQMRKAATGASRLGKAVDDLLHNLDQEGVKSEKTVLVLKMLDPFPTTFKAVDVKQEGSNKAYAQLVEDTGKALDAQFSERWDVDLRVFRALAKSLPQNAVVELRLEGDGDKKAWKLYLPVTPALRESVDSLNSNYQNYSRALEKVKFELKRDASTKSDVEKRLKEELEAAK